MPARTATEGITQMKPSLWNEGHFNAQEQLSLQVFEKDTEFAAASEVRQALHKRGERERSCV